MQRRILFVDDEPRILNGIRRMLRPYRSEWDMEFLDSASEALELLKTTPFDVVVSDMRMPEMDGADLLEHVRVLQPSAARIVLSGQSDQEMTFRAVGPTHQYLSKPCTVEVLCATLRKAIAAKDVLNDEKLQALVAGMEGIPVLPGLYTELIVLLERADATEAEVSEVISIDPGMSAKLLQLVNTSFFGLGDKVQSIEQAVHLLGVEIIRSLVLSLGIFSRSDLSDRVPDEVIGKLWHHSITVAVCARQVAHSEGFKAGTAQAAFSAGLLHDIGALFLFASKGKEYIDLCAESFASERSLVSLEKERYGNTHADLGAYLLSLWGLPDTIVLAVAHHEAPEEAPVKELDALLAVHVADAFETRGRWGKESALATSFLEELGVSNHVDDWKIICQITDEEELGELALERQRIDASFG